MARQSSISTSTNRDKVRDPFGAVHSNGQEKAMSDVFFLTLLIAHTGSQKNVLVNFFILNIS